MLLLWAYKFIAMPTAVDTGGLHSYFFRFSYESQLFQYMFTTFAFVLAYAFACYASKANFRFQVVESGYQLPTIFFVLLTGSVINTQRCIPEMVSSIFVSLAVLRSFCMYNKHEALKESLDVGLLYGIALVFAYKYIALLPAIIIIMVIVKPMTWRDLLSFFISLLFVVATAFCLVWIFGDFQELIESIHSETMKFVIGEKYNYLNYVFQTPVIFSVLISLLSIFILTVFRKAAEIKFHHSMLFLLLYYIGFLALPISSNESIWLIYFPLCYLLSNVIINTKKNYVRMIVFYGLIVCIIVSQLMQIMYFNTIF